MLRRHASRMTWLSYICRSVPSSEIGLVMAALTEIISPAYRLITSSMEIKPIEAARALRLADEASNASTKEGKKNQIDRANPKPIALGMAIKNGNTITTRVSINYVNRAPNGVRY